MKKIILSILFSVSAMFAFAQGKVTFSPAVFTAEDEVKIILDVTGTPLAGQDKIYIWAFSNDNAKDKNNNPVPGKDAISNGQWTGSSEAALMTKVGANLFEFKFVGTALFGQSPAELINFGFLAKTKDGGKQTPDYKPFLFDPLVFVPSQYRVFPAKLDYTDVATVYFQQDLAFELNLKRMYNIKVNLIFYNEAGNQILGSKAGIVTVKESDVLFSYSFIPDRIITLPAGTKLGKFSYQFTGTVKDVNGVDVPTVGPITDFVYTVFN